MDGAGAKTQSKINDLQGILIQIIHTFQKVQRLGVPKFTMVL